MEESIIRIENVTKRFDNVVALDDISLEIPEGSFTTLLGPSGCGKTTLMRLIAGFYEPDNGSIYFNEKKLNGVPAFRRNTPLVFQEYALFPHMTVYENISYGLKLKKVPKKEIQEQVMAMLNMFGLQGLENRSPKQLSGGQQQRVAFARALIMGQKVLLMDEPLSNLDAKMRVEVRNELRELQQRLGFTAIFVTHDQDEAMSISDKIVVFNKGHICQVGSPWEIYFKPESQFVADFVGAANFLEGTVIRMEDSFIVVKSNQSVLKVDKGNHTVNIGDQVTLVIRPECISLSPNAGGQGFNQHGVTGQIVKSHFLGRTVRYWVEAGTTEWIVDALSPTVQGPYQGQVTMYLDHTKVHLLAGDEQMSSQKDVTMV
jgi:ABC-type Fe3+/spermidine/putrescine transport system ATPase subunit